VGSGVSVASGDDVGVAVGAGDSWVPGPWVSGEFPCAGTSPDPHETTIVAISRIQKTTMSFFINQTSFFTKIGYT
jgi:hypothetical protein